MSKDKQILKTLNIVIGDFFKKEKLAIKSSTTANDIEEWDSLNHMDLIRTIEEEFNIEFEFFEVMDFENIGELVKSIEQKM
ncbi:MAG: acyl carrier protein [Flavobacteriales bacterium]|nr:acyl carrier protein [Flavobacteriales bacterium]